MADVVIISSLYLILALELVAQVGAVFFAYRLTRLTGSFRAWTLIIASFLMTTLTSVVGLFYLLTWNPDQLVSLVQSVGFTTTLVSDSVVVISEFLLFFGIWDMVRTFKRRSASAQLETDRGRIHRT
jgi:hypothetical protein